MTRMNSAVSELVKMAKTPVQTEANEYFQNARDALRRGLYPEALEEAEKAIAKHKLEWRYYSLAGTIRLGSTSGGLEMLDLAKAEEYFSLAARYAKADNPQDAARSYLAASWAAYCQGKMGPALTQVEQAVELDSRLAEALFQAGKVYMALREPESALPFLGKAIELDKGYALKAAADGDFQRYELDLRDFLESLRQEKNRQICSALEAALNRFDFWLSKSREAKEDPLVVRAKNFLSSSGLPLWDLLTAWEDLSRLPAALAERASKVRLVIRTETPGPEYDFEETDGTEQNINLGGRLLAARFSAPAPKVRKVKRSTKAELVAVHDAAGAVSARIDFLPVPPASFLSHREFPNGESRRKRVRLSNPFIISVTAVTVAQYRAIVPSGTVTAVGQDNTPIVNVSWYDAINYCNALSREVGFEEAYVVSPRGAKWKGIDCEGYRLLTDAEWDWACFGPSSDQVRSWAADDIDKVAWVKENSDEVVHPVGLKEPNRWGLLDMFGNVAEWVFDWYVAKPWSAPEWDPFLPTGGDSDNIVLRDQSVQVSAVPRATRGGSCLDPDSYIRNCAPPRAADPKTGSRTVGFRLARTVLD